jgi:putative membrane-bound dehydrogenase-like protein
MKRLTLLSVACLVAAPTFSQDIPKAADPRLVVELVAAAPDIVHPISCDFDHKGRLLVIESHTHFAPKGYQGPKFDRIRAFDVKTGKATTFFEGTRHTMDLAVHPFDGAVYLASRSEILRLRETKDGVKSERIAFLDTKGDYPHNGLSGLCFDSKGDLYFGMGENLGARYTLIGTDGVKFSGEGDGGHIFHCTADGKKLRKVATGFWNPFGICRDIYGRVFAVDNDPDQAPPCRMLHVVEGGDYGFRFMYGRSGKHPFQSWHGELPGTLPMMTGVGEAPCEILSYESDGLPDEYRGQLLVTSWADHRVERYKVVPHGASFKAERLPFVQGGANFRPTGMCVAPDGSLYVCDWVLSNYTLHGKGAIWHIREKQSRERKRPVDPREAIFSMHRPLREAAARELAKDEKGRLFLRSQIQHSDGRVRATVATSLVDIRDKKIDLKKVAESDAELGVREIAVRGMVAYGQDATQFLDRKWPDTLRANALLGLYAPNDWKHLIPLFADPDPFLFRGAIERVAFYRSHDQRTFGQLSLRERMGFLLALQRASEKKVGFIDNPPGPFLGLNDPDEIVRFLAVKWIADEKPPHYREDIEKILADPKLSVRMYLACATALARLDGKEVNEKSLADYFAKRLADQQTPPAQLPMLLRQVPASHPKLTVDLLARLLKSDDAALKMEAVRALVEHPNPKKSALLLNVFRDPKVGDSTRAFATLGLGDDAAKDLMEVAKDEKSALRIDALRALNGKRDVERDRPAAKDIDAWAKRLEGNGDAEAGARVFFHPKLAGCYKCHRIDGRGADVGPDLSSIGRTERRHILESILQPSNTVAPHYVAWHLETADGKVRTGMLLHTQLDEYTYLDAEGKRFKLKTGDLVEQRPLAISIMPEGLVERMTDQEIRDLLAYLQSRK